MSMLIREQSRCNEKEKKQDTAIKLAMFTLLIGDHYLLTMTCIVFSVLVDVNVLLVSSMLVFVS